MSSLEEVQGPNEGRDAAGSAGGAGAARPQTPSHWRSLEDLAGTPEYLEAAGREFAPGASELPANTHSRRGFLQVMGASLSLAGLTGCRWPKEKILPFARREAGHDPSVALRYATACDAGPGVQGLLVTSYDGRPVKIEGNPRHPVNQGAADLLAQASLLGLYDPDRSKAVVKKEGRGRFRSDWGAFEAFLAERAAGWRGRGDGVRVLAPPTASPTLLALQGRLRSACPGMRWHTWAPWHRGGESAGARLAFGAPWRTRLHLEKAEVIVALDDDFLFDHPEALRLARAFAAGRRGDGFRMNRLHVVESAMTQTGAMADHRSALPPSRVPEFVRVLAAAVFDRLGPDVPGPVLAVARSLASAALPAIPFATQAADDLVRHRGHAVVTLGARQPAELHALVQAVNLALGAAGSTVEYALVEDEPAIAPEESLRELVEAMRSGAVETLVILGGNPAFDAPADLDFAGALQPVRTAIRLGLHEDETTAACFDRCAEAWHLPEAHYLESWGDLRAWDGTLSVVQPLIAPLYDGRSAIEVAAGLAGEPQGKGYDLVRATTAVRQGSGGLLDPLFEASWRRLLEEGLLEGSARPAAMPEFRGDAVAAALDASAPPAAGAPGTFELLFSADHRVWDGRYGNNAWLQETPDPLTKITWDNALLLSPRTAAQLGVRADDLVTVKVAGRAVDLPAYLMPGTAPQTAVVHLGHGRREAGTVARERGFDVYPLRTTEGFWSAAGVALTPAGRRHALACTQNHHAIDPIGQKGIDARLPVLIREATLGHYQEHPEFAKHAVHHPPLESLWKEHAYEGHRWGMAIDLSSCIGCSACVVACTAENNVPVVGKERVLEGREMHWLRLDRYFTGEPEAPQVAYQPVACVHCEMAPCEQVCPVAATVHDHEGLNVMVYNRCIGTRYCSNNCPFKVRRFNFFNYRNKLTATEKMAMNPDVTVRSRGVMEKCTYCVQRIESARITAKNENRAIRDGEVTPACAQTCPTQAIVFGDLNDAESRVARLHAEARSYAMLSELNIKPRTLYLAKLRNPAGDDGHGGAGGGGGHGGGGHGGGDHGGGGGQHGGTGHPAAPGSHDAPAGSGTEPGGHHEG